MKTVAEKLVLIIALCGLLSMASGCKTLLLGKGQIIGCFDVGTACEEGQRCCDESLCENGACCAPLGYVGCGKDGINCCAASTLNL